MWRLQCGTDQGASSFSDHAHHFSSMHHIYMLYSILCISILCALYYDAYTQIGKCERCQNEIHSIFKLLITVVLVHLKARSLVNVADSGCKIQVDVGVGFIISHSLG